MIVYTLTLVASLVKTLSSDKMLFCEKTELSAKTGVGLLEVVWYQLIPNVPQL